MLECDDMVALLLFSMLITLTPSTAWWIFAGSIPRMKGFKWNKLWYYQLRVENILVEGADKLDAFFQFQSEHKEQTDAKCYWMIRHNNFEFSEEKGINRQGLSKKGLCKSE